mmetsp:Transcript_22352/g.48098  ORF Transcript_22352/g.48098 Transcript_22352/m.48098 type:complete len:297 (+) Transcript_22352:115-1005(+)
MFTTAIQHRSPFQRLDARVNPPDRSDLDPPAHGHPAHAQPQRHVPPPPFREQQVATDMRDDERGHRHPARQVQRREELFVVREEGGEPRCAPAALLLQRLLEDQVRVHDGRRELSDEHEHHRAHVPRLRPPGRDHVEGGQDVVSEEGPVVRSQHRPDPRMPGFHDVSHDGVVDHVPRAEPHQRVRGVLIPLGRRFQPPRRDVLLRPEDRGESGEDQRGVAERGDARRDVIRVAGADGPSEVVQSVAKREAQDGKCDGEPQGEGDVDVRPRDVHFGRGAVERHPRAEDEGDSFHFFC